ncbi:hypothetical protein TNCV_759161 [Trichonephila clavipes]|nr:hypothetical protein TNCV_759161 [Trichonephila clavipes]
MAVMVTSSMLGFKTTEDPPNQEADVSAQSLVVGVGKECGSAAERGLQSLKKGPRKPSFDFGSGYVHFPLIRAVRNWEPIYDKKVRGMLIKPASSQMGLVKEAVVLLENSITMRITEQHNWIEGITQLLYIQNCIEEG